MLIDTNISWFGPDIFPITFSSLSSSWWKEGHERMRLLSPKAKNMREKK